MDQSQEANLEQDTHFMGLAIELARQGEALGEVPIGAVVVKDGVVIGSAHNVRESHQRPTGHAELLALEAAAKTLNRWRLVDCTLYVTLEPCVMCAGAVVNSRVARVVFGAPDPKAGAVTSLYSILSDTRLNHRPPFTAGVLGPECASLLSQFFRKLRDRE